MNKCCFIIPYFGKLPKTFPIFLKSCAKNPEFNWLIFTNDDTAFDYPLNVSVVHMTLDELSSLADKKLGFKVALDKAYKLCDFKPAYGFIFEDYIQNYSHWGHCDIDTVLGDLKSFLTDDLLSKYDKLFCMGHFIIYKNSYENNRVFMSPYKGICLYKDVFTSPQICWFDEEWNGDKNINRLFISAGKSVLQEDYSCNFNVYHQKFIRETFSIDEKSGLPLHSCEKYIDALYYWSNGHAGRIYIKDKRLFNEEFMYMHFQWRKMHFKPNVLSANSFKVIPNSFVCIDKLPSTISDFNKIRRWGICFYKLELFYKEQIQRRVSKLYTFFR